jgi:hypothetical protein
MTSDERLLTWTTRGGVSKAAITTSNLSDAFEFLGKRPVYMDRWFVTSDDPEHTKRQFGQVMVKHRPALEVLYNECRAECQRAGEAVSSSSILTIELGNQDDDLDLTKMVQIKRHLKDYDSSLTMAEVYAGSLLLHLDEIVQSLVIELTHDTKWVGIGELFHGIPLSDTLKACGNFVRHKTDWTLQMSRTESLNERAIRSLWRLGALLTGHPEHDHDELSRDVFRYDEHMRRCIFILTGVYQEWRAPYQRLEERIIKLGSDVVDAKWTERLPWDKPNASAKAN